MRLVIDQQDIPCTEHVTEHVAHIGFVALGAALVHAALSGNPFLGFPVGRMPVPYRDPALAQLIGQGPGNDTEHLVVVLRMGWLEYGQTALDREARSHDQDIFGKTDVLRVGDLVPDVPCSNHGHDNGLASPGSHLGTQSPERSAIRWDRHADPVDFRPFGKPDERFHCLDLAEEKTPALEFFRVGPIFKKTAGYTGNSRVPGFAPGMHARAQLFDKRDFNEHARIVESLESGEAMTYPAGQRPSARSNRRVFRSWCQCLSGS